MLAPFANTMASVSQDADYYQKYLLFQKYEKKQKYDEYKKLQRVKKDLGFDKAKTKDRAKKDYVKYKTCKRKKSSKECKPWASGYKKYSKYKKYSDAGDYKKYENYNIDQYENYKGYGGQEYKDGYNRYIAFMNDLGNVTTNLGPEIRVGIWSKNSVDSQEDEDPFRITANKPFTVSDCVNAPIESLTTPVNTTIRVANAGNGILNVYHDDVPLAPPSPRSPLNKKVCFQASDGNNTDMIFDVNTPTNISKAGYERYRGKIKIQHSSTQDNQNLYENDQFPDYDPAPGHSRTRLWVINTLPLEQYMWGYGEMSTGGIEQLANTMIVTARSYARWYIDITPNLKKWGDYPNPAYTNDDDGEGFDILSYSFSQIYNGYDYEVAHQFIPEAAKRTNGIIMKYGAEYVMASYCSNTDGNTRNGDFPYLVSVPDPYGKIDNPSSGNHMIGLSANGAKVLARDYNWSFPAILTYYYTGINIIKEY